jgi:hypothetical protein
VDLDTFLPQWQMQRWIDVGLSSPSVGSAMVYFFPWWCGTAYWWGWGGSGDCIDVGVGEAQSVDVVPIEPVGVTLATWPPT